MVTLITDLDVQDGATLDKYFQFIYERVTTMLGMRQLIKEHAVEVCTVIVWLLVGNCQIPISRHWSPVNQLKKLINTIVKVYPLSVGKIWVAGVLPRADREVQLEAEVKAMNKGFAQAMQDLKRYFHLGKRVEFIPTHQLFLERYKYCDLVTDQDAVMTRIVKPLDRYFVPVTPTLNLVGKYHLKSYLLQTVDVLNGVNSWQGVRNVQELEEMRQQKRLAWLRAHEQQQGVPCLRLSVLDTDLDTELEDEVEEVVVRQKSGRACSGYGAWVPYRSIRSKFRF